MHFSRRERFSSAFIGITWMQEYARFVLSFNRCTNTFSIRRYVVNCVSSAISDRRSIAAALIRNLHDEQTQRKNVHELRSRAHQTGANKVIVDSIELNETRARRFFKWNRHFSLFYNTVVYCYGIKLTFVPLREPRNSQYVIRWMRTHTWTTKLSVKCGGSSSTSKKHRVIIELQVNGTFSDESSSTNNRRKRPYQSLVFKSPVCPLSKWSFRCFSKS